MEMTFRGREQREFKKKNYSRNSERHKERFNQDMGSKQKLDTKQERSNHSKEE